MEGPKVTASIPLLGLGLAMTGLGALLLLLSFRSTGERGEAEHRTAGVVFIGPIPIVFGGRGRWAAIGATFVLVIVLLIALATFQPDLIGW
jgi:uncharacterized protein (TIGR00304 family)